MSILIDGYNLLHASGIFPRGVGPGTLERARGALLNFLVESLNEEEIAQTTVVFDAAAAPPGLPSAMVHRGLSVLFARKNASADELIEELIVADHSPKRLTVVSSDHRLHRAANRRKATPVDSDRWFAEVVRRRADRGVESPDAGGQKPSAPSTEGEIEYWLKAFQMRDEDSPPSDKPGGDRSPFPPGYGEDIREDEI